MTKPLTPWLSLGLSVRIRLEFKLVDFWVGAYWSTEHLDRLPPTMADMERKVSHLWICLLPCLPIHVEKREAL